MTATFPTWLNRPAILSLSITLLLAASLRAGDRDVFELLTGRSPSQSAAEKTLVGPGVYVEPSPSDAQDVFTLLSQAEEIQAPVESRPTAPAEMMLNRPISQIAVTASLPVSLTQEMQRIPKEFQIGNPAEAEFGDWSDPRYSVTGLTSGFAPSGFCWAAPAVYHRPLYFEQPNVERYGHYVSVCKGGNCLQSAVCAAHFFGTIPLLPYKVGADPCGEKQYVLGCYRPGSCNPHQLVKPELSCRGLALQGVTVTGLIFLIP